MERNYAHIRRLTLLLFNLLFTLGTGAKPTDGQKPLVIICDWDMPPYEYLDNDGKPAGYTVDLLSTILDNLHRPYTFEMKENTQAKEAFVKGKSDLIIVPDNMLTKGKYRMSTTILSSFQLKAVMRVDATPIHSLSDIGPDKVVVIRKGDDISHIIASDSTTHFNLQYHAPMEALSGVASGKYDYYLCDEEQLRWKLKELNLENLSICNLSLPKADVRFCGYDQKLIDAIDDQYARMEQNGELNLLRDKWFHPDRHHDNASPIAMFITIAAVLLLALLAMLNMLVGRSVKKKTQSHSEQTRLMNLALDMGGYMVTEYDARQDTFKNLRGNLVDENKNMEAAKATLHQDDLEAFNRKFEELRGTEAKHSDISVRLNKGTAQQPDWQYLTGNCIKEHNEEKGNTTYLLVVKDITQEIDEQLANNELAAKFSKAFETALIAMSFYSKDGKLLAMNKLMKEVIGLDEENQQFFYETTLFNAPLFRDVLTPGMTEPIHACQHMYYPDINLNKYLEYHIKPAFTEDNEIRYYMVTTRDITAERKIYLEQQATERQLKVTNDEVNKFEQQMNYLLSNCGMFIWRSNIETHTIDISRSLRKISTTLSFDDYLKGVSADQYDSAQANFFNPLMYNQSLNLIRHYTYSSLKHEESWFAISGMPYYGKAGNVLGHFGVIRDVSQLMRAQEELRKETIRAEESGQLKAAFLANMTHEIRTPLNAIVGFSDLLHMAETPEDRAEFIRIIRHNCDLLLRLIDDILETSVMNEHPQTIEAEDTDFSSFFDEVCQMVAQRVQEPGVEFIKDNPHTTFPARTDKERTQQVITNFVTNAVKYTHQGHIKVGYRAESREVEGKSREGIYIYCEDTGTGIPKEKQASVFDRFVKLNDFVQGTGLGLSICKSIAERCGGAIGVDSEGDGKGSTFWLWIPRYLT